MNKSLTSLTLTLIAPAVFAATPFAEMNIGAQGADGKWAHCMIVADTVSITDGGGTNTTKPAKLNQAEFAQAIIAASKQPTGVLALHNKATSPEVTINAGVFSIVEKFELYKDASDIRGKQGGDAAEVVNQVHQLCRDMKAR